MWFNNLRKYDLFKIFYFVRNLLICYVSVSDVGENERKNLLKKSINI